MMRVIVALGLAAGLLAGCRQTPLPPGNNGNTATRIDLSNPEKVGYLVGSIGANTAASDANQYILRLCDSDGKVAAAAVFTTFFGLQGPDVREGNFVGDGFVIALPEGRYEICQAIIRRSEFVGLQLKGWNSATQLTVKARETRYLGRFIGSADVSAGLFEERVINGAYWEVIDGQTLDLPAILKKLPADAPRPVVAVVAQSELNPPIFRRRATP